MSMRKPWREPLLGLWLVAVSCTAAWSATDPLEVHFIDVGTGDCIWIHTGDDHHNGNGKLEGYNIIIDGGDDGSFGRIKGYDFASQYLIQEDRLPAGSVIEWMILTHPHSDHVGGLPGFLMDYDVRNILDPGHDKQTEGKDPDRLRPRTAYGRFFQAASTETLSTGDVAEYRWGVPADLKLDWGSELDARVLWSSKEIVDDDLNNTSIVLRLGFTGSGNDASFLFMGDAENFVEEHLVATFGDGLRSQVLKAGHHGSNSSTTVSFLQEVQPEYVVISSGSQSFSGTVLPRTDTFARISAVAELLGRPIEVLRTDRGDKEPFKTVGTEGGDDTIVARTRGKASDLTIEYVHAEGDTGLALDPSRCQALTQAGKQCKRSPKAGSKFCWQHGA